MIQNNYLERLQFYLKKLELNQINDIVDLLIWAESNGSQVFIAGNGGSASTASHMATDLFSLNSKVNFKIKVSSLCDNNSLITAIGNDNNFSYVFCEQIKVLGKVDDVLIVISASGNSPNLICAVETANTIGMKSFGMLGFNGGKIKNLVSNYLLVETKIGDYGPSEDIHLMVNHIVKEEIIIRKNSDGYRSREI